MLSRLQLKFFTAIVTGFIPIIFAERGTWNSNGNYEYYVSDKNIKMTYINSKTICEGYDGRVAMIKTQKIQGFIQSLVAEDSGAPYGFYIGLRDEDGNNQFVWDDRTELGFSLWHDGEPSNNAEQCAQMGWKYTYDPKLDWYDTYCGSSNGYVCERLIGWNWGSWQSWGNCSCPGIRKRNRICVDTNRLGPLSCNGTDSESTTCRSAKNCTVTLPQVTTTPIPRGRGVWIADGGYEYYVSAEGSARDFENSQTYCSKSDATLALVKTPGIHSFLQSLISNDSGIPYAFYIGIQYNVDMNEYLWTDGTSLEFTNWDSNQTNENNTKTCVTMGFVYEYDENLSWRYEYCSNVITGSKGLVCQRKKGKTNEITTNINQEERPTVTDDISLHISNENLTSPLPTSKTIYVNNHTTSTENNTEQHWITTTLETNAETEFPYIETAIERGTWNSNGSYEYYVSDGNTRNPYSNSKTLCEGFDGRLAMIKTQEIQEFIQSLVAEDSGTPYGFYIGLRDEDGDNQFVWDDGTELGFSQWLIGEPSTNAEQCAIMGWKYTYDPKLDWYDIDCGWSNGYVCERLIGWNWGSWQSWGNCSCPGIRKRNRICVDTNRLGPLTCNGTDSESTTCRSAKNCDVTLPQVTATPMPKGKTNEITTNINQEESPTVKDEILLHTSNENLTYHSPTLKTIHVNNHTTSTENNTEQHWITSTLESNAETEFPYLETAIGVVVFIATAAFIVIFGRSYVKRKPKNTKNIIELAINDADNINTIEHYYDTIDEMKLSDLVKSVDKVDSGSHIENDVSKRQNIDRESELNTENTYTNITSHARAPFGINDVPTTTAFEEAYEVIGSANKEEITNISIPAIAESEYTMMSCGSDEQNKVLQKINLPTDPSAIYETPVVYATIYE